MQKETDMWRDEMHAWALLLRFSTGGLLTKIFSKQGLHTDGKFSPAPDVLTSIILKSMSLPRDSNLFTVI